MINSRIDFMILIKVENCNPNGDPVHGNYPRVDFLGFGEISDVCIKRKIRNRLQDMGKDIFMVSDDRVTDGLRSSMARLKASGILETGGADRDKLIKLSCDKWIDTRMFGQIIATKTNSLSVGIRGPISIGPAISVTPIFVNIIPFIKSFNYDDNKMKDKTTYGAEKYSVSPNIYVAKGSIYPQLARNTNLTHDDIEVFKECVKTLFINDASSARPSGSMEVAELLWFTHNSENGDCSPSKVFNSVKITQKIGYPYYNIEYPEEMKNVDLEKFKLI